LPPGKKEQAFRPTGWNRKWLGCPQHPASLLRGVCLLSTLWRRLGESTPIDETAQRVVQPGVSYEAPADPRVRSFAPLPTRPVTQGEDITGKTFGRFKVIGLSAKDTNHRPWVVRCTCGWYEHRRASFLKRGDEARKMCSRCDHLERVKRGEYPKTEGS